MCKETRTVASHISIPLRHHQHQYKIQHPQASIRVRESQNAFQSVHIYTYVFMVENASNSTNGLTRSLGTQAVEKYKKQNKKILTRRKAAAASSLSLHFVRLHIFILRLCTEISIIIVCWIRSAICCFGVLIANHTSSVNWRNTKAKNKTKKGEKRTSEDCAQRTSE